MFYFIFWNRILLRLIINSLYNPGSLWICNPSASASRATSQLDPAWTFTFIKTVASLSGYFFRKIPRIIEKNFSIKQAVTERLVLSLVENTRSQFGKQVSDSFFWKTKSRWECYFFDISSSNIWIWNFLVVRGSPWGRFSAINNWKLFTSCKNNRCLVYVGLLDDAASTCHAGL